MRTKPFAQRRHAHAGRRRAYPARRPTQTLPADLDAIPRFADEPSRIRPDHDRPKRQRAETESITRSAPPVRSRNSKASSMSMRKEKTRRMRKTKR